LEVRHADKNEVPQVRPHKAGDPPQAEAVSSRPAPPVRLARAFVGDGDLVDIVDMIEQDAHGWEALCDSVAVAEDLPGGDKRTQIQSERPERLRAALPEALRQDLCDHDGMIGEAEIVATGAGFLVGVEVSRRMVRDTIVRKAARR
jgi:hypothetical protein